MRIRGTDHKTVFILGAGATRGAIRHVLLNRKRLKPPLNGDFFQVADTFARARGATSADATRLKRLRRFFRDELAIKGDPSMEEAFSLLYIAKDFPEIYHTGPGRKAKAGKRQEIEDFLRLTFSILATIDRESGEDTAYDTLAAHLGRTDTIITLNYDTLLDSALVRRGWNPKIGYCLGGGKRKIAWQPEATSIDPNVAGVRLLKLHGSVNWYVRGSFGSLARVFESKPVRVGAPRVNEIKGHIRQIVPPIFGKFFGHAHWRTLWERGSKALREADDLVVIGCSLVDTDFHLRALLGSVTRWRKTNGNRFRRAYLVDHSLKVRRKWQKVLKGSVVKTSNIKGFEKFLTQELKG